MKNNTSDQIRSKDNNISSPKAGLMVCIAILAFFLGLVLFVYNTSIEDVSVVKGNGFLNIAFFAIAVSIIILLCITYFLIYIFKAKIEVLLLLYIIVFGTIFSVLLSPGVVPDEPFHINTAYQYSNVMLGIDFNTNDGILTMRQCDADAWPSVFSRRPSADTYKLLLSNAGNNYNGEHYVDQTPTIVDAFPLSYFASALGMTLARIFNLGTVAMLYSGRTLNLVIYAILCYFAVKLLPFGKEMLFVVALFPMCLQQAASYSYDAYTIGLSFLVFAYFMHLAFRDPIIQTKNILILSILTSVFVPSKVIYVFFLALFFIIPSNKFSSKMHRIRSAAILFGTSFLAFGLTNLPKIISMITSKDLVSTWSPSPNYTFDYIFHEPLRFIKIFANTFVERLDLYIGTTVGNSLGWLDIPIPWFIVISFVVMFLIFSFHSSENEVYINKKQRLWMLFVVGSVFVSAIMVMFIACTPIGCTFIEGVQGRYFLPIIPLLGIIINNTNIVVKKFKMSNLVLPVLIINTLVVFHIIGVLI